MIMLMGPRGSGKSTLIKKLAGEDGFEAGGKAYDGAVPSVKHTTGVNLAGYTPASGGRIVLREIGSSVFPLWTNFLDEPSSEKIIFMMDGSNRLQVAAACCQFLSVLSSDKIGDRKVALVVSKSDYPGAMSAAQIMDAMHFDTLAASMDESRYPAVFAISVVNNSGLSQLQQWMELR